MTLFISLIVLALGSKWSFVVYQDKLSKSRKAAHPYGLFFVGRDHPVRGAFE